MNAQEAWIPEGSMVATALDLAVDRDILLFALVAGWPVTPGPVQHAPLCQQNTLVVQLESYLFLFQTPPALPSVVRRRTGSLPTPSSATSTTSAWPRSRKRSSALTDSCSTQPTPTRSSATIPSTWTAETENMFVSAPFPFSIYFLDIQPIIFLLCRGA